jgi:hypothetical protein
LFILSGISFTRFVINSLLLSSNIVWHSSSNQLFLCGLSYFPFIFQAASNITFFILFHILFTSSTFSYLIFYIFAVTSLISSSFMFFYLVYQYPISLYFFSLLLFLNPIWPSLKMVWFSFSAPHTSHINIRSLSPFNQYVMYLVTHFVVRWSPGDLVNVLMLIPYSRRN